MAKDAELDRLKAAQDLAFQRKQDAYQAQQHAWERRSSTRDVMNGAHEAKQLAYAEQDRTWQYYQGVRNSNGPRIDSLDAQQERAYQDMKRAFDNASAAHDRRDGASARSYADEGHRYKEESQGYVAERRRLVEEIRSARASHEASKTTFQRAKDAFNSAKRTFDLAKVDHEQAQAEFKKRKAEFDAAAKAFRTRLENVKAEGQKKRESKKSIAAKAGVPHQHRDNVWISKDSDGNTNIYFGGVGEPNGPGHGHYVLDRNDRVTYRRDPFDPHGAQNVVGPNMKLADGFAQFHSQINKNEKIEYFVTKNGLPTIDYPHVHVTHHRSGRVDVVASRGPGDHPWRHVINDPAGNKGPEIQSAIREAQQKL